MKPAEKDDLLLKKIGKRVRELRLEKDWSQIDLAIFCESHKTHIARIERGEHNFGICTLQKIADVLEVPLSKLLE